ncbi:5385_t:CDS:2 [Paraglomus brasilianum]|uniref:5385_t:CDS:1 n=1 Tax=Paraglomus brasilianum TaxID=144538 RepID=A0A9N8Z5B0_9GLOM|nr:5385_t:CDS:2 [Paraglomus brasilianum]
MTVIYGMFRVFLLFMLIVAPYGGILFRSYQVIYTESVTERNGGWTLFAGAIELKPVPDTVEIVGELIDSPFSQIINGQPNYIKINFNNKGEANYTLYIVQARLVSIDGSDSIVKNLTTLKYNTVVPAMEDSEIRYVFYSEMQPQELTLIADLIFTDEQENMYSGLAYANNVTIVDPEQSIFDLQLIFMYAILLTIAGGVAYLIKETFFGGSKKKKSKKPTTEKTDSGTTGASTGTTMDWIPEHHLKKSKSSSKKKN